MVLPEDLENFTQMSKHGFLIARPVPETHRRLIRAIFNDRRIGHYIRELQLDRLLKVRSRMIRNCSDEARALYNQQRDLVDAAVAQSGVPAIQSFYGLHIAGSPTPRNSHEELLVALLLSLLPNLNSLFLTWTPGMNYLRQMIRHGALDESLVSKP